MLNQRERASGELANVRSERGKVIVGQDADAEERAVFMLEHDTYWLDE